MIGGHELGQILRTVGVIHNVVIEVGIRLGDFAPHVSQHSLELFHGLEDGGWGIVSGL